MVDPAFQQELEFAPQIQPSPIQTQALETKLAELLKSRFGMSEFRRGQLDILKSVAQGHDTLAVMPTGGGKSLCYQLPSLLKPGIVLVISPLIALMKDQVSSLKKLGVAAGALHSGMSDEDRREVFRSIAVEKSFVLYVSPERTQFEGFATWIAKQNISLFAIDEAHCLSQWGPDFRTDYHKLTILRKIRPQVPILALTATATPPVLRDIEAKLSLRQAARHVFGFYRPNLYLQIEPVEENEKVAWVKQALTHQVGVGRALIYCGTRKQAHAISTELKKEFEGVGYYHAGLSTESRNKIQSNFENGKLKILAATYAFGMGIDRPDVRLVIHYQMPANIENYYQEIGRAGRDALGASCLLLYARKDKGLQSYFIQKSDAADSDVKLRWRSLETFVQFLESEVCRFAGILTYFKDVTRIKQCGHCDVCAVSNPLRVQRPLTEKFSSQKLGSRSGLPKIKIKKKVSDSSASFDSKTQLRSELLRDWRKSYAEEHDIPAFVVFSNKTLEDLAEKNPTDQAELLEVYGFGTKKSEHLGPLILALLKSQQ